MDSLDCQERGETPVGEALPFVPPPHEQSAARARFSLTKLLKPVQVLREVCSYRRLFLTCALLFLVLFVDLVGAWPVVQPSTAFALGFHNPNPSLSAPSWLSSSTSKPVVPSLGTAIINPPTDTVGVHPWKVSMKPARLTLSTAAQHFVGSDGSLSVDIAANSLTAAQLTGAGGKGISLYYYPGPARLGRPEQ